MRNRKMAEVTKEATTAVLVWWQKSLNCWQIAFQFEFEFPLWAKYTIAAAAEAAAAEAAAIVRAIATCNITID